MQELADALEKKGRQRPLIIVQDLTEADAAERIKTAVDAEFPRLDILINNAGGSRPLEGLGTSEEWDEAMRLNFHAGREIAHAFVPGMQANRFGRIINITGVMSRLRSMPECPRTARSTFGPRRSRARLAPTASPSIQFRPDEFIPSRSTSACCRPKRRSAPGSRKIAQRATSESRRIWPCSSRSWRRPGRATSPVR